MERGGRSWIYARVLELAIVYEFECRRNQWIRFPSSMYVDDYDSSMLMLMLNFLFMSKFKLLPTVSYCSNTCTSLPLV